MHKSKMEFIKKMDTIDRQGKIQKSKMASIIYDLVEMKMKEVQEDPDKFGGLEDSSAELMRVEESLKDISNRFLSLQDLLQDIDKRIVTLEKKVQQVEASVTTSKNGSKKVKLKN